MRQLLPTPAMSPPRVTPIPSDRELLIQRLMGTERPMRPVLQECSGLTDIDILLQVEIDWDHPGGILSPGCPHHPCLSIQGTRRLPFLSPIKKHGW